MKELHKIKSLLLLTIICIGCSSQQLSTVNSAKYNEQKNRTDYFVLPFGSTSIPGKWTKTKYNEVSHQQFFKNKDSVSIAIAFTPVNKYEFNTKNPKKGFEFVNAFYEWDSEYFVTKHKLQREKIESNELQKYIIWRLLGKLDNANYDTYFLFGEKNGYANNFSVSTTNKWSSEEKVKFLKEMYFVQ